MWRNIAHYGADCVFALPTSGTVTSCDVKVQNRSYSTCVIPKKEAEEIAGYVNERKPSVVQKEVVGVETLVPDDFQEAIPVK